MKIPVHDAPIVSSYNDRIRPLLDTIDRLRHLKVMQEGIQLPTIVVVGDQSSGKSSVLESLAGISLPRGQGICTRVPLIMRLQNHQSPKPQLSLEFNGKSIPTDETKISSDIRLATEEMAGKEKGISNKPLTLIVKKNGVPDLTMVDLPGITRVPVHGQPQDIYEQVSKIIMEYITPEESIILNVLSASVDFSTCESIRMSQSVDKTGQRTLAVVTKADESPKGLMEKVTADDVNIGLGYVCVRNRIGDESYEEARDKESRLFHSHPLLSSINKSIVGIPVLAERLMMIQATIIVKCLPEIIRNINEKLYTNEEELNKLPDHLSTVGEANSAFVNILAYTKESLKKIMVQAEFEEFPDLAEMHATARLSDMLNQYSHDMKSASSAEDSKSKKNFLADEIKILEETKSISLPNFLPKSAFHTLLHKKLKAISTIPLNCVEKIWSYIQETVTSVLMHHCENYPQLIKGTRKAAHNVTARKKQETIGWVKDLLEMEKIADYTCDPQYTKTWTDLMSHQDEFMKKINSRNQSASINRFGSEINIAHLHSHKGSVVSEAFDLKMRVTAYWDIVLRRMVDNMALHLLFSIQNLVNKELQVGIVDELMGPNGLDQKMLGESPSISEKRKKLKNSIKVLKECKDIVATIMD